MIISSIPKKDDIMKFPEKTLTVLYAFVGKSIIRCLLKDEVQDKPYTKSFHRIGDDIKSGVDLGDCQEYIPAEKKTLSVGEKIPLPDKTFLIIRKILRKTNQG